MLSTERYSESAYLDVKNPLGADHIVGHSIIFDNDWTYICNYVLWESYLEQDPEIFPEAREECNQLLMENKDKIALTNSLTISFDGKYVIPYCYGLEKLYIYEIKSLYFIWKSEIELKSILNIKDKVEAVRFFKDYLIILDSKKIIAYSMKKGREFKKIGEFYLEHRLYTPSATYPDAKVPTLMRNMEMDGDYLYILNPPGNDLGPLLTFKINDEKIELINDGSEFKATFNDAEQIFRINFNLNQAHGKKYIIFSESARQNQNSRLDYRIPLFRLENNIPIPIDNPFGEGGEGNEIYLDSFPFLIFKNDFLYVNYWSWRECALAILYFTEDEEFVSPIVGEQVYDYPIWKYGMYQGPDTELLNFNGRSVSCSTDDLPTIEYIIKPEEASQNFLVMGRAYDSEGKEGFCMVSNISNVVQSQYIPKRRWIYLVYGNCK